MAYYPIVMQNMAIYYRNNTRICQALQVVVICEQSVNLILTITQDIEIFAKIWYNTHKIWKGCAHNISTKRRKKMTTMYIIWAVAIVVFAIAEAMTTQLVSIWFVIGSIAGLISALCKAPIVVQVIIFIAVSILMLIITRPIAKKKLTPRIEPTNADKCIGQEAIVTEEINNIQATGQAKTDGKIWSARSSNGDTIPNGTIVIVEKIEGVKLIVRQK